MKSQLPNLDKNLAGFSITYGTMNIEQQKVCLEATEICGTLIVRDFFVIFRPVILFISKAISTN